MYDRFSKYKIIQITVIFLLWILFALFVGLLFWAIDGGQHDFMVYFYNSLTTFSNLNDDLGLVTETRGDGTMYVNGGPLIINIVTILAGMIGIAVLTAILSVNMGQQRLQGITKRDLMYLNGFSLEESERREEKNDDSSSSSEEDRSSDSDHDADIDAAGAHGSIDAMRKWPSRGGSRHRFVMLNPIDVLLEELRRIAIFGGGNPPPAPLPGHPSPPANIQLMALIQGHTCLQLIITKLYDTFVCPSASSSRINQFWVWYKFEYLVVGILGSLVRDTGLLEDTQGENFQKYQPSQFLEIKRWAYSVPALRKHLPVVRKKDSGSVVGAAMSSGTSSDLPIVPSDSIGDIRNKTNFLLSTDIGQMIFASCDFQYNWDLLFEKYYAKIQSMMPS